MKTALNRLKLCLGIAAFALPGALSLRAETGADPATTLESALGEIMAIAYPSGAVPAPGILAAQARPVLERYIDFSALTRRAIGPGWSQFSAAQRTRATELFTLLVVRTYTARFRGGERPAIDRQPGHRLSEKRWEVPTSITLNGSTYAVVYRFEGSPGAWRIHDIVIEGVSFVANYRAQFDALFQKGGADGVLKVLEAKQLEAATAGL